MTKSEEAKEVYAVAKIALQGYLARPEDKNINPAGLVNMAYQTAQIMVLEQNRRIEAIKAEGKAAKTTSKKTTKKMSKAKPVSKAVNKLATDIKTASAPSFAN